MRDVAHVCGTRQVRVCVTSGSCRFQNSLWLDNKLGENWAHSNPLNTYWPPPLIPFWSRGEICWNEANFHLSPCQSNLLEGQRSDSSGVPLLRRQLASQAEWQRGNLRVPGESVSPRPPCGCWKTICSTWRRLKGSRLWLRVAWDSKQRNVEIKPQRWTKGALPCCLTTCQWTPTPLIIQIHQLKHPTWKWSALWCHKGHE